MEVAKSITYFFDCNYDEMIKKIKEFDIEEEFQIEKINEPLIFSKLKIAHTKSNLKTILVDNNSNYNSLNLLMPAKEEKFYYKINLPEIYLTLAYIYVYLLRKYRFSTDNLKNQIQSLILKVYYSDLAGNKIFKKFDIYIDDESFENPIESDKVIDSKSEFNIYSNVSENYYVKD